MRMSREMTLFNAERDRSTVELAIDFATMIATNWTSSYSMEDARNYFGYNFWYYNGANGFEQYASTRQTTADCSSFMTVVWAVATATAYKSSIALDNSYVKGRKIVPMSRNTVDPDRPSTLWCPSTDQLVGGNGVFQGLTSYGFSVISFSGGNSLQAGDVGIIQNSGNNVGHTFMILEPSNGDWNWNGSSQKYFTVVHCSPGSKAIRIQENWPIIDSVGRTASIFRYTYQHS